jgi:hypothetical protein
MLSSRIAPLKLIIHRFSKLHMTINKEKLNNFIKVLKEIEPNFNGLFRCPICLSDYLHESDLVNGHIIPKALGGKAKTIVCRKCDTTIGSKLEGPLINHVSNLNVLSFKKNDKIRSKMTLSYEGKTYKTRIELKDKLMTIKLPNPGDIDLLTANIKKNKETNYTLNYHFKNKNINNRATQLLGLKIAYYAAFNRFGYRYILNSDIDWIRDAILNSSTNELPYKATFYSKMDLMSISPIKMEFIIPEIYFEKLRVPIFISNHTLVILPPFSPHSIDDQKKLFSNNSKKNITIKFVQISNNSYDLFLTIENLNN